jgi:hypothetical protein
MRGVALLGAVLWGWLAVGATPALAQAPPSSSAPSPAPHELVNNPAFAHWAGFKRGTTVFKKQTVILSDGRKIEHEITVRLAEKTRDKVVIETTISPTMDSMVSSTRTFTTFPAKVRLERAQTPRSSLDSFAEGEELMTVAGRNVNAHWVEAATRAGDETSTRKVWSAREVPGGVVKETIVRKKGDQVLSDSILQIVRIKTP